MIAWDHLARAWVVAHRYDVLDGAMWGLSAIGRGGIIWLIIGGIVAFRRSRRGWWREFAPLAVALLFATITTDDILKPAFDRHRPFVTTPDVRVIGGRPRDASFPSGHAANAFAGAVVLSTTIPSGRLIWWPLAIAIAYSRVYLGVHYPLDVVAGSIIGAASAAIVVAATRRLRPGS
jgi:undecaprenyl-diphosphatase